MDQDSRIPSSIRAIDPSSARFQLAGNHECQRRLNRLNVFSGESHRDPCDERARASDKAKSHPARRSGSYQSARGGGPAHRRHPLFRPEARRVVTFRITARDAMSRDPEPKDKNDHDRADQRYNHAWNASELEIKEQYQPGERDQSHQPSRDIDEHRPDRPRVAPFV
jgi:hypothetical protein